MTDKDFKYLVEEFGSENVEPLKQKGDYTYKYLNSFERFNEEKLPDRKYFYSSTKDGKISDGHISAKYYFTCEKICGEFEMKNMGDYHNHYLNKNTLLLADVFEKFIATCLKCYWLDHCHYFSSPGLTWNAMTGVKLEKISDIGKYVFIEKELRGGISCIAKIFAKANWKCVNDYDPKKPSTYISYLDMNNLYGWAMKEYLPYEKF